MPCDLRLSGADLHNLAQGIQHGLIERCLDKFQGRVVIRITPAEYRSIHHTMFGKWISLKDVPLHVNNAASIMGINVQLVERSEL